MVVGAACRVRAGQKVLRILPVEAFRIEKFEGSASCSKASLGLLGLLTLSKYRNGGQEVLLAKEFFG